MFVNILKAKLHNAVVTDAKLNYEGSIEIDSELLELSGMLPFEKVDVYNITNGERFSTYIIKGKRGSRKICLNGAAARKVSVGDRIIIAAYILLSPEEAEKYKPTILILDEENNPTLKN